jgi:hypothetical protein
MPVSLRRIVILFIHQRLVGSREPLAFFRVPRSPSSRLTVGMTAIPTTIFHSHPYNHLSQPSLQPSFTAIPTTIFHSNPYNHPPQMREDEFGLQLQRMQD